VYENDVDEHSVLVASANGSSILVAQGRGNVMVVQRQRGYIHHLRKDAEDEELKGAFAASSYDQL
jgi:hypothetical protein